jgi:NADH dehydrogenase
MAGTHQVVIVGGGFGGLYAARALARAPVAVTLLDRRNFHLFQPLLYQVAMGGLSPANIAAPLRGVLRHQRNALVLLEEVVGFDLQRRRVLLKGGGEQAYDSLIVAAGARHHYFGHAEWEKEAPGLKTIEDALTIRRRVLAAFEEAEATTDDKQRAALLTFVVVGGGPTGVELAGALAELAHYTLRRDFRRINPRHARILLIEGLGRVLNSYPESLSAKALRSLQRMGVTVRLGTTVKDVRPDGVTLRSGGALEEVAARTVLWGAGVDGSSLGKLLADATGAQTDKSGRVKVLADLSLPGRPEVFVIGDLAHYAGRDGQPLPGVAQVAMQQGKYVADRIRRRRHHRPGLRGGRHGLAAPVRLPGLDGLAVHPPALPGRVREPRPGAVPVGLELRHAQPLRPPHHRRGLRPRPAARQQGGRVTGPPVATGGLVVVLSLKRPQHRQQDDAADEQEQAVLAQERDPVVVGQAAQAGRLDLTAHFALLADAQVLAVVGERKQPQQAAIVVLHHGQLALPAAAVRALDLADRPQRRKVLAPRVDHDLSPLR